MRELFDLYLEFVADNTESAFVYHRWSFVSILGTLISKKVEIPMGHFTIYCNMYIQLLGKSGCRKSSAIIIASKLLRETGFDRFAPKKCSKEAFLHKLVEYSLPPEGELPDLEEDPFVIPEERISNMLIAADEFNAFLGNNYDDFLEILSELFDMPPLYDKWLRQGSSDILNPFITILSGNTPSGFRLKFSGNSLNQGILTRFLIVPWHETRCKIAFPEAPDQKLMDALVAELRIVGERKGSITYTSKAKKLLSELYEDWEIPTPIHMEQYVERRYVHLLRLCAIFATAESDALKVTTEIVLMANTILASNESNMATAFRDIFDSPNQSTIRNVILDKLKAEPLGLNLTECYNVVSSQVDDYSETLKAVDTLVLQGDVIKADNGKYLIKTKKINKAMLKYLDLSILTEEERKQYGK